MKTVWLILILANAGHAYTVTPTQYPDMQACEKALKESKTIVSSGAESENVLAMFCSYSLPQPRTAL